MSVLLLHGSGWDEFLLLGGAILLAFLIVRLTARDSGGGPNETPES
jgi:hypothetical protein